MIFFIVLIFVITIATTEQQINNTITITKQENITTVKELVSNTSDLKESTTLQPTDLNNLNATNKVIKVRRRKKTGRKNRFARRSLRNLNKDRRRKAIRRRNTSNVSTTPKPISLSTLEAAVKNETVELIQMVHDAEVYPGKVVEVQHDGKLSELNPDEGKPPKSRRKTRRRLKPVINTVLELPYIYYKENDPVEPERRYYISDPDVIAEYLRVRRKNNNDQDFRRNMASDIQNSQAKAAEEIKDGLKKLVGEDKLNYEDNPDDYVEEGKDNNAWDYQHQDWAESHSTKNLNWDDNHDSEETPTTKKTIEDVNKSERSEENQKGSVKKVKTPSKSKESEINNEKSYVEPIAKFQIEPELENKNEQEPNDDNRTDLEVENEAEKEVIKVEDDLENDNYKEDDNKVVTNSDGAAEDEEIKAGAGSKSKTFDGMVKVEKNRIPLYTDVVEYNNKKFTTKATTKKDVIKLNETNKKRKKPIQSDKPKFGDNDDKYDRPKQFGDKDEKYDQKRRPSKKESQTKKHYDNESDGNKRTQDKEYVDDYDRPAKPSAARPSKQKPHKPEQVLSDESNENMNQHAKQEIQKQNDRIPKQKNPKKPQREVVDSKFRSEKDKSYGRSYKEDEYYDHGDRNEDRARKPVAGGDDDTGTKWSEEKRNQRKNKDYDIKDGKNDKKSKPNNNDGNIDYDYDSNNKKSKAGNFDKYDRSNEYGKNFKSNKNDKIDHIDKNYQYDLALNFKENTRLRHDRYSKEDAYSKENTHSRHDAYSKENTYSRNDPYKEKSHSNKKPYEKGRAKDYDTRDSKKSTDYEHQYEEDSTRSSKGTPSYNKYGDYGDTKKTPTHDEKSLERDHGGKNNRNKDYDTPTRDSYGSKNKKKKGDYDNYDDKKHANNDWDKVGIADTNARETRRTVKDYAARNNIKLTTNALWDRHGNNEWDKVGIYKTRDGGTGHRSEGRSGGGGGGQVGFGRTPLPMNRHKTLYEKQK